MAAVPVSSLPGPGPPPQSTEVAAAAVVFSATFSRLGHRQQQHVARGRAWRGVATGGDLHRHGDHDLHHRWARHKERQPSEGELLQRAPHNITITTSLTLSPGRTRPKKEDWLKKKDRKQRRPGCRRKKTRKRGA